MERLVGKGTDVNVVCYTRYDWLFLMFICHEVDNRSDYA